MVRLLCLWLARGATELVRLILRMVPHPILRVGAIFSAQANGKNPNGSVVLTECASVGFCAIGAAVMVYPDGVWYAQVRATDVPEIVEEHLINGRVVERLALLKLPAGHRH